MLVAFPAAKKNTKTPFPPALHERHRGNSIPQDNLTWLAYADVPPIHFFFHVLILDDWSVAEKTAPEAILHLSVPLEMLQNFVVCIFFQVSEASRSPKLCWINNFAQSNQTIFQTTFRTTKKTSIRKKNTRDSRPETLPLCRCAPNRTASS